MTPETEPGISLREHFANLLTAEAKRTDDLRLADSDRRDAHSKMARRHRRELATAEAKRLDAISAAEKERVNALLAAQKADVSLAYTRAELTATALAERVEESRKTLASQVEASAAALRATNEATAAALSSRIVPLEQARYEASGGKEQKGESRQNNQWAIGLALALPSAAIALIALVVLVTQQGS